MTTIYAGTKGYIFTVTAKNSSGTAIDVSLATTKQLLIEKPDGTTVAKDCTWVTDGTDGMMYWTCSATDFPSTNTGNYKMQPHFVTSTKEFWGEPYVFVVSLPILISSS